MSDSDVRDITNYACATCGQVVTGRTFHSYESCLLWKSRNPVSTLDDAERAYIWQAGLDAMRQRVERQELPATTDVGRTPPDA